MKLCFSLDKLLRLSLVGKIILKPQRNGLVYFCNRVRKTSLCPSAVMKWEGGRGSGTKELCLFFPETNHLDECESSPG